MEINSKWYDCQVVSEFEEKGQMLLILCQQTFLNVGIYNP